MPVKVKSFDSSNRRVIFLIHCLENGWGAGVEEFLNYIKNKNYKVYEELYKGIKYKLEVEVQDEV